MEKRMEKEWKNKNKLNTNIIYDVNYIILCIKKGGKCGIYSLFLGIIHYIIFVFDFTKKPRNNLLLFYYFL